MSGMSDRLRALIEKARGVVMSPEQRRAQEIDFAWGNVALEYPEITREMVEAAYERLHDHERRDRGAAIKAKAAKLEPVVEELNRS